MEYTYNVVSGTWTSKGSVFCFDQMKMMGISQNAVTFLCMLRFGKAKQVLEGLRIHKVVSWNALLARYGSQGQCYEVLYGFEHMQSEGLSPDAVTFICILKACRSTETMHIGEQIHERIMSTQLQEGDIVLGTT